MLGGGSGECRAVGGVYVILFGRGVRGIRVL